jgi:hypothetical protein
MYSKKPGHLLIFAAAISLIVSCTKDSEISDLTPSITSIYPATAGKDEYIIIRGKNFIVEGHKPEIKVRVNDRELTIAAFSADSAKIFIPKLLGSGKIMITVDGTTYPGPDFTYRYKATVTTIAGTGSVGDTDGAGCDATFNAPWGITADTNGDLFIADTYNRLIRKISAADSKVSSIHIPIMIGNANFYSPYNITVDRIKHDLYVTDFNQHLLKISPDNSMSVIYTGTMPTTGIAMGADGFLYISNNTKGTIIKLNADGKDTVAFSSGLLTPRNIIFDKNNNMFVAAAVQTNGAIYKIDNAGKAALLFSDPEFRGWDIAVDSAGNFYGADHFNNRIRLIEKTGRIITLAGSGKPEDGDGVGLSASFDGPQGITTDTKGNFYVTTYNYDKKTGNKVRKIVVE